MKLKNNLRPYGNCKFRFFRTRCKYGYIPKCSLFIFLLTLFVSCLQSTMEEKLFYFDPVPEDIVSRPFSCDNSDLLIVNIYGGTLQSRLIPAHFTLTKNGEKINLTAPVRADDNCVLFSFSDDKRLDKNSNYRLIIKPQAIQAGDFPRMVVVKAVTSGSMSAVSRTGFDNSVIRSVCYGGGNFIAVGDMGKMSYSADGTGDWITVRSGDGDDGNKFTGTVYDIASNISGFYAVGAGARMSFSNTTSGINVWTGHRLYDNSFGESMFGGKEIRAIEYGRGASSSFGRFVAAGEGGNVIFRWDIDSWRRGDGISSDNIINTLAFGDTGGEGIFIAGGYCPVTENNTTVNKSCLYWARDGIGTQDWNGTGSLFADNIIRCSAYGNGVFVIGGDSGKLSWSPDGKEWTAVESSPFGISGVLSVVFGSGVFIAAGHDGRMAFSADGIKWNLLTGNIFESTEQINGIATDGRGRFAAVGNRYGDNKSKIVTWYQKPPVQEVSDISITINRWATAPSTGMSNSEIRGMAWNGSGYIAVGEGKIAYSANGTSWTENTAETDKWYKSAAEYILFRDVVWGGEKFVAVGFWVNKSNDMGVIAVSDANGENWNILSAPKLSHEIAPQMWMNIDPKVYSISFANGTYVAVGELGWSAWSSNPDTTQWNPVWITPFSQFEQNVNNQDALSIATDGLRFVVGGTRGRLAWSSNGGRSWTWIANSLLGSEYNDILSITYGDGKFIAAGSNGRMKSAGKDQFSGESGSGWQTVNSGIYANINAVIWGGGYYAAVGDSGSISLSADGNTWQRVSGSGWNSNENIYSIVCGTRFISGGRAKIIYSE